MNKDILINNVARLLESPKGILAIDESLSTCNKRFEALGVPTTEEKRQEYRELLITAPGIEQYVSGYILFDETIRQNTKGGKSFTSIMQAKGLQIGIKVDTGLKDIDGHPGEKVTQGLEDLPERLNEYRHMGATFAKWRAVYTITDDTPSSVCMQENARNLAEYAYACQLAGIVPIVEPEVLTDGEHSIEKCFEVTGNNLRTLFTVLQDKGVFIPGIILKTSMVLPGKGSKLAIDDQFIAQMTIKCLKEHVPQHIGGIVFLSGGMKDEDATLHLNNMHKLGPLPWPLTFSYGRAIQNPALKAWVTNPADIVGAQKLLLEAAERNSKASIGKYE